MRVATFFSACLVAAIACSDPRVAEDRAAACANKIDDDADGLVDCADPDCSGTEACEQTSATCSNSLDDDRDGTLDCRQESCRALPVCRDAVRRDCVPTASVTGCQRGKGCYLVDNESWCALEGTSLAGDPCGGDPGDRSQGCAAGYQCGRDRRCTRFCTDDYDCTRNSICLGGERFDTCTLSCLRSSDCRAAEELCVPLQRDGFRLEEGGWAHRCVPLGEVLEGTAQEGQPCVDPANTGGADVCALGLLCIPEPDGARCREVCRGSTDGRPTGGGCPSGRLCYAAIPFSGQDPSFEEPYAIGVCL